jgi:hypothetical protein
MTYVYVTANWRTPRMSKSKSETIRVQLSKSLDELIDPPAVEGRYEHGLFPYARLGPDLIGRYREVDSREGAIWWVCKGARILQFMDATGLRASGAFVFPDEAGLPPGSDHVTSWYDRVTRCHIAVDEPVDYSHEENREKRLAWANRHKFSVVKSLWKGMHHPEGGTQLYLWVKRAKRDALGPILEALAALDPPIITSNRSRVSRPRR